MKILNGTPRPNVPSQKAWLEIASDNQRESQREKMRHNVSFFSADCVNTQPQDRQQWLMAHPHQPLPGYGAGGSVNERPAVIVYRRVCV